MCTSFFRYLFVSSESAANLKSNRSNLANLRWIRQAQPPGVETKSPLFDGL